MDAGPIEYFVFFLRLCIVGHCNVFELLDDVSGVLCDARASLTTSKTNVEAEASWKTSSASFLNF
jgi:hypothetical protein